MFVVFVAFVILVVEMGSIGMLNEAFVVAWVLVVVVVCVLELDAPTETIVNSSRMGEIDRLLVIIEVSRNSVLFSVGLML